MDLGLSFRTAGLGDKTAILGILTPYGGRDYMADTYEHMIQQPNFVGVVAELVEGFNQMVAFAGAYIVNGGTTMLTVGSRVRESFQGKGVYTKLLRYLEEKVAEKSPGVKYEEITVNNQNRLASIPGAGSNYTELYRTPLKYYSAQNFIPKHNIEGHRNDLVELETDDLRHVINDVQLSATLFPKRLVLDWHVYHPTVENVDIIAHTERYITGSAGADGKVESMVFGAWYQCDGYLSYCIDFYGSANKAIIVCHFLKHFEKGFSLSSGSVRFLVAAEAGMTGIVDDVCLTAGLKPEPFYSHYVVLSRKL